MPDFLRSQSWLRHLLLILFTAGMYILLARLSLFFQFESSNATPVWPSAGFALAMVIIYGMQVLPGIFLGAFVANLLIFITNQTVDYPMAVMLSMIIGIGNTGEAFVGNYLLKKTISHFNLDTFLDRVDHVLRYSAIVGLMCIVSSSIGALSVYFAGIIPDEQVSMVWLTWWLGDFSGILLVASLILIWLKSIKETPDILDELKKLKLENFLFYVSVILSSGIIFDEWISISLLKWPFWVIPFLVWAALRFHQRELITSLMIYSVIAIWGTIHDRGPFSDFPLNEALLALQTFIAIMVVTKLTLNASVSERRETEMILRNTGNELDARVKQRTAQLEERNTLVETILNASFDSIVVLDQDLRCISINKIA